jgi:TM2 domain-containing membrane protein YozV
VDAPRNQPKPKSLRFAVTLNFVLPGAGQFYLGQRVFGGVLALAFLICFAAMMAIFLRGYVEYMRATTSGDIFQSDVLEQLGNVFHVRWLLGLLVGSIVVFIISMAGLAVEAKGVNAGKKE